MQKILPVAVATIAMVVIALVAVWTQEGLLVPSLGSAVFIQAFSPTQPSATPYSIGVGQVLGVVGAFVGVYISMSAWAPEFTAGHALVYGRVLAVLIAVLLTAGLQLALKATSPAGGATALVVALGIETPNWAGAGRILVGILLVTVIGEVGRQLILRQQERSAVSANARS
jgi:hypothetical protein